MSNIEGLQDIPGERATWDISIGFDWQELNHFCQRYCQRPVTKAVSWQVEKGHEATLGKSLVEWLQTEMLENCCGWLCYDMCNEDISYTTNKFGNQWPCVQLTLECIGRIKVVPRRTWHGEVSEHREAGLHSGALWIPSRCGVFLWDFVPLDHSMMANWWKGQEYAGHLCLNQKEAVPWRWKTCNAISDSRSISTRKKPWKDKHLCRPPMFTV